MNLHFNFHWSLHQNGTRPGKKRSKGLPLIFFFLNSFHLFSSNVLFFKFFHRPSSASIVHATSYHRIGWMGIKPIARKGLASRFVLLFFSQNLSLLLNWCIFHFSQGIVVVSIAIVKISGGQPYNWMITWKSVPKIQKTRYTFVKILVFIYFWIAFLDNSFDPFNFLGQDSEVWLRKDRNIGKRHE